MLLLIYHFCVWPKNISLSYIKSQIILKASLLGVKHFPIKLFSYQKPTL